MANSENLTPYRTLDVTLCDIEIKFVIDLSQIIERDIQKRTDELEGKPPRLTLWYNNSIHKPPRPVGMRIEKVLPLPGEH